MKKILSLLLSMCMVGMLLVACSSTNDTTESTEEAFAEESAAEESNTEENFKITFVSPLVASPYFVVMENGIKAAAEELGIEVECVGTSVLDMNKWMEYVDAAIANESDAIITMTLNEAALMPAIELASEKDIPFILVDTDAPDSSRISYLGTNNKEAGRALGEELIRLTGGEAKIGLMSGALDQPNLNLRVEGFREAIADSPGMEEITFEVNDSDLAKGIEKTEAMLTAYPEITALVGFETFCIPGFSRVVSERGVQDQITIVGFDDTDDTINSIKEGIADGTIVQRQYLMGYEAVKTAVAALRGEAYEEIVDTGVVFLNQDNIETFDPESVQ